MAPGRTKGEFLRHKPVNYRNRGGGGGLSNSSTRNIDTKPNCFNCNYFETLLKLFVNGLRLNSFILKLLKGQERFKKKKKKKDLRALFRINKYLPTTNFLFLIFIFLPVI